jgi:XTP/dITP diphosphohydrolase
MNTTLIFATNNQHKIEEIQSIVPPHIHIITLEQAGINITIPEPYNTLHENAQTKAQTIFNITHQNCFSEDTGLEVVALNGEPGVKSARYAGDGKNFEENINLLLEKLKSTTQRMAQFRTVIALIWNEKEYFFEGICKGTIVNEPHGSGGFGYDAVFIPDGSNKTFATMSMLEKNNFSHRKKATQQLISFLANQ